MVKRIIAVGFIFLGATAAWMILGATIFTRTYSSDGVAERQVESLWGATQTQQPPTASWQQLARTGDYAANGQPPVEQVPLSLEASRVEVGLDLAHRQKGLLWYSTYKVAFTGIYTFRNATDEERLVNFRLNFPTSQAIYDDLVFTVNDTPVTLNNENNATWGAAKVAAGKTATLRVGYRSQGLDNWRYDFGDNVAQVKDFALRMKTNFKDIDFPENSLSPTEKHETADGWELSWNYKNLLSGYQIALAMPEKLQPGPLAGRISFFAPVSLFFFFFLMFIITTLRGIELHPMNYFFLATAFFSFHLLMAYLVDHISLHSAFGVSAAVSIFLVVSYLRLAVGLHFAVREAVLAQFIYLVAFSYAFFLKGFTGLAITIGSILTLFVVMQVTGRIRWADKFKGEISEKTENSVPPEKVSAVA
jgi:hypothetical protein